MKKYSYANLMLIILMLTTLVACGSKEEEEDSSIINYEDAPNQTANDDTKWIDSEIYGAIDESLVISEKDDFYTAVNKDWLLEQEKPTKDKDGVFVLLSGEDIVKERLIDIVSGKKDPDSFDGSQVDIADEEIAHNQELVVRFVDAVADWDARNAAGVEPLRKYIEDIQSISTIEDMTAYIADFDSRNVSQKSFLDITTYAGIVDAENNRCIIQPDEVYTLEEAATYTNMGINGKLKKRLEDKIIKDILIKLGYDEALAEKMLVDCYRLEGMLIDHTDASAAKYENNLKKEYSLEEIKQLAGRYPFEEIYRAYGYTATDNIRVTDKAYIKYLNSVYKASNLDMIKSYFIVQTIDNNAFLLGRDYYDMITEDEKKTEKDTLPDKGKGDVKEAQINDEWDIVLNRYALKYLAGPLNIVYISRYCSAEQKQQINAMIDDIIDSYHDMIDTEDWLSASAREATKEKLDYMTVRTLYPDQMDSYEDLIFDQSDDLVAMVQKIRSFERKRLAKKANTPVDKELWDLQNFQTTTVNAFYQPDSNGINILAGIVADDDMFSVDNPYEVNLARLGTVIGHEISHAFDSQGCDYDKLGYKKPWWDLDDVTSFQMRVNKLAIYYGAISPYPGAKTLNGMTLSGEAIADMGGMKVALMIAKDIPDFDYDLFFKSYAQMWRASRSLGLEMGYAESDVHPLNYLRTNVTLMQFDEFIDTYGIKAGDGMYCAPENRINVW